VTSSSGTTEAPGASAGADPGGAGPAGGSPARVTVARKPRKIFLVVGLLAAGALAIGLFTGVGTGGTASRPQVGKAAPSFSVARVGGSGQVGIPGNGGGNGRGAVLLFFGNWCAECHSELPPLAAAIRSQQRQGGVLSKVSVIGVDDFDHTANAESFIRSSGVSFPVAFDPVAQVTNGLYYFPGDPAAVFIDGNGTITAIRYGPITPTQLIQLATGASKG
jgi:peroxiredoxin